MNEGHPNDPKPSCLWLNITPRAAPAEGLSKTYSKDSSDEASTPTTAPQTPGTCRPAEVTGRCLRLNDAIVVERDTNTGSECGPITMGQSPEPAHQMSNGGTQQTSLPSLLGTSYQFDGCMDSSSTESKCKVTHEGTHAITVLESTMDSSSECVAARRGAVEHASETAEDKDNNATKSTASLPTQDICLQHLLEQYRHRRAAFERNCSRRYKRVFEVTMQKRQATGLWRLAAGDQIAEQRQRRRLSPAQARLRKGHEGDGNELTASSSGEEAASRGAGEHGETSGTCGEGDTQLNEGGFTRRAKGSGQRSFPYKQFHVHHFLPEPENKVGLLTHPAPAQFKKYPKARGVWFDPHRNLVRTCWKENGKAKTMGFPVNKFGLEEARTLAVEYHYYKCPTDPLPDDLLSLVPRKPPHAYGWC